MYKVLLPGKMMGQSHDELLWIASQLDRIGSEGDSREINEPLESLKQAALTVGKASSASWIGYHAHVYYEDLQPIPPYAQFSPEWGMMERFAIDDTRGAWRQYSPDDVKRRIIALAGEVDLANARAFNVKAAHSFEDFKLDCVSILTDFPNTDAFIEKIKTDIEALRLADPEDVVATLRPNNSFMTRDSLAASQGYRTPPHIEVIAEVISLQHTTGSCKQLAVLARKAGSHLLRKAKQNSQKHTVGTNIFIGHGRTLIWKNLKDFVHDRLGLPHDEFNRVPVAGITNIDRLSQMLNDAVIAFLVMTGEDETTEGKMNARMNVIHEVGLFQGRLGFTRAIVLLEEGCEEFTNIQGLGQIRFPKNNIEAAFEEIRLLLEREGIL